MQTQLCVLLVLFTAHTNTVAQQKPSFTRNDVRKLTATEQLELIRRKDMHCEYCVSPEELNDLVAHLDARDEERKRAGAKPVPAFTAPSPEQQKELQRLALSALDSDFRLPKHTNLNQKSTNSPNTSQLLHMVFLLLDHDHDNRVSVDELFSSVKLLLSLLLPDNKIFSSTNALHTLHPTTQKDTTTNQHLENTVAVALHDTFEQAHTLLHAVGDSDGDGFLDETEFSFALRLMYSACVDLFRLSIIDSDLLQSNAKQGNSHHNKRELEVVSKEEVTAWATAYLGEKCAQSLVPFVHAQANNDGVCSLVGFVLGVIDGLRSSRAVVSCLS